MMRWPGLRAVLFLCVALGADAEAWSEKCLRYFQTFSNRPLPEAGR